MEQINQLITNVPSEVWVILIETIVAALLASPVVSALKKWFAVHSDKVALFLTIIVSIGGAAGAYLINDPAFAAWWVPVHGWLIFATTQPIYRYLLKPLGRRVQAEIDKAIELEKLKKSAKVPADGLPQPEDFSGV